MKQNTAFFIGIAIKLMAAVLLLSVLAVRGDMPAYATDDATLFSDATGLTTRDTQVTQATVGDINMFSCGGLTVTVSGSFSSAWDDASLVDGTNKAFAFNDVSPADVPGDGTNNRLGFGMALSEIQAYPVSMDYGDGPASYGDPCHSIIPQLYLGAAQPDNDRPSQDTTNADGDNLNGINDEDALPTSLPTLNTSDTSYTLSNISVTNSSGTATTLSGWIDFNRNGSFDAAERTTVAVPSGGGQNLSLTWSGLSGLSEGDSYVRLRLSPQSNLGPAGNGGLGEVEDYSLQIINVANNTAPVAGFGNSLDFDGTNEFVEIPYAAPLNPNNFTVEGWVNTRQSSTYSAPFSSRDSSVSGQFKGWTIYNTAASQWEAWLGNPGSSWLVFQGPPVQLNTWTHIAFTFNSGTAKFYVDGELRQTQTGITLIKNPNKPFRIGASDGGLGSANAATFFFNGFIDEVRLWNGERTAAQLKDYRFRYLANPTTEPGLVSYWAFNQSSGTILTDLTGGHNGTLQAMEDSDWKASASPPALPTNENQPVSGYLKASDDDADALTFIVVTNPAHGAISNLNNSNGSFTYTPNPGYCGPDSFTFKVNDGIADSNTATANLTVACLPDDHGDAPVSYLDASHTISASLRLDLTIPDSETSGYNTANADGDNTNGTNDEQGVATPLPTLLTSATVYTLTNIQAVNNTGRAATLYGWIDLNRNGTFDPGERTSVHVPATAGVQSVSLVWSGLNSLAPGQSYLRLRLSDQRVLTATGVSGIGEVEDYPLQIQPPVVITVSTASVAGGIGWVTSSPAGIACPSACTESLLNGTSITLTATPKFGSAFSGWSGGGCSGTGACVVTINANTAVTATFGAASFAVGNGKITFNSNRDGNNEIYVMNPDGSGQTRLTNNPADDHAPAWSPNGTQIAFWRGSDLYVMNADGTGQTRITTVAYQLGAPRWSPDGTKLVFSAIVNLTTPIASIYTINVNGTGRTQLTTSSVDLDPDWSPNGDKITFVRSENIYVMNADGTGQTVLVDLPGAIAGPRWSPNGNELTFAMSVGRNTWEIFRMNADGSGLPTELTNTSATNSTPGWSPDGRRIVFDSNISGSFEIIHFEKSNGDAPIFPTNNRANDQFPDWQPIQVTTGTLIVGKSAFGGNATFAFTSTITGNTSFNLAPPVNGEVTRVITNVTPGSYAIQEIVPAGWAQIAATCDNGDTPDNVTINAGDQVTCIFTNVKLGSLTVVKNTVGGDGNFDFTSTIPGNTSFSLSTAGGRAQRTFANLTQGSYAFTETVPSGWAQTGATCSGGNTPGNINLKLGEDITCTITNTKQANLTLIKNAAGGDATFPFTSTVPGAASFNLTTSGGITQTRFANLTPGSYAISETVPSGWTFTGATCSDGSPLNAVNLSAGEDVTCTVDNARQDTIIVIKRGIGADATFPFTSTIAGATSFSLTTVNGEASRSFTGLNAGTYRIVETPLSGWEQSVADPVCSNGDPASAITLGAGETVVCVFVNLQDDTIAVEKRTIGGDGVFAFTSNIPGNANFSLTTSSGVTSTVFSGLNPVGGSYSITETVPSGWELSGASCDNGDTPGNINLAPGAKTTCVFTNTKQANLTLVKFADGGDGSFGFTSDIPGAASFTLNTSGGVTGTTFSNLTPATYVITETTPADWVLTIAVCDNGDDPSNGVTLTPGADVTCLYLNQARATLTVVKQAEGGDATFPFTSTIAGAANFNLITSGGVTQTLFSNVAPGTYSLAEVTPTGWAQSSAICSNGNDPASLLLLPGSDVTCTFTNGKEGSLTIVKQADPNDGTPFVFGQDIDGSGAFTLTHALSTTFSSVAPGSYNISETLPSGWHMALVNCQAAGGDAVRTGVNYVDAEFSVVLAPGEEVTCTVENKLYASLTIEKVTTGGDDTFTFTSPFFPSSTFSLTTVSGIDSVTFDDLPSNLTYTLLEDATPGWASASAICDNGDSPNAVFLAAGDDVTCTFSNEKTGSITIVKQANPDDGTPFGFTQDIDGSGAFTLTHALSTTFSSVAPGSYSLSETLPSGWYMALVNCQAASGNNVTTRIDYPNAWFGLDLLPGEDVTCTVANDLYARLTIVKQADGGDATFEFSSPFFPSSTFSLTTVSGSAQITFDRLPGNLTYELNEASTPGWALTEALCDNGDTPDALFLAPGDNVTCIFRNGKEGTITVVKDASPADNTPFDFTITGGITNTFTLRDPSVITQTFGSLASGDYVLTELLPTGWTLENVQCQHNPNSFVGIDYGANRAFISLAAGDNIVCTFKNAKRGQIIIEKRTTPVDIGPMFEFTQDIDPSAGNFTINHNGSSTFLNVAPGRYEVTESSTLAQWQFSGLTCNDGASAVPSTVDLANRKAIINVELGETVRCVFTNEKKGSLTLIKDTVGGDGVFSFASPSLGTFSLTTTSSTAQTVFTNIAPGSYAISETVPAGWDLTSALCSDGSPVNAIAVGAGEDVTCTFTNTKRGNLTVVKNATGGDGVFNFSSPTLGGFALTTTGGTAQQLFANLVPGSYAITETVPAGWTLTGATCSDGSPLNAINIAAGENVTCTFDNLKQDTIIVVKRAVGGDGTFAFNSPQLSGFSLSTVKGKAQQNFSGLLPGSYSITETVPAGWTAQDADPLCSNGQRASSLSLAAGQSIVCEFVNLKNDTIVVEKKSIGGDGAFAFTGSLGSFSLGTSGGSGTRAFTNLTPGTFSISETVPAGWVQSGATCSDGSNPNSITLAPGATVTCTFTNTRLSGITVIQRAIGGNGTFDFAGDLGSFSLKTAGAPAKTSFNGLASTTYAISETVPAGWDLTSATCFDGSNPAAVDLAAGENVTCIFVNTKRGSLTVVKQATGGDAAFDFTSNTLTPSNFSLTTSNGTAQRSFVDLTPGVYDLTEAAEAGWRQDGVTCSDGSSAGSIDIGPGEDVTCTFANTRLDTITVIKRTVGGDATFNYTSNLPGGNFSLTTAANVAQRNFANLNPGTYSITETVTAGWTAQDVDPVCSNGQRASSLTLAAGQNIVCEFVNRKDDTLVVEKKSIGGDGTFAFTSNLPGNANFNLTTSNGDARTVFTDLIAGTYSISESVPTGWDLTGLTCSDGRDPANLVLRSGESVTCTFTNTKRGSITLVKNAVGGDDTFAFSGDLGSFTMSTSGGTAQQIFANLRPGSYTITETVPAGWDLTSATCDDGSSLSAVTIGAGEDVTCTVENTKRGSLTVVKNAVGGDGVFSFTSQALGNFDLTTTGGTAQRAFASLVSGLYDVMESVPTHWDLTNASCDNGDVPATVDLSAGEAVTCTFENTFRPPTYYLYLPIIFKQRPQVVYNNTFAQGPGSGWTSGGRTTTSPSGEIFLGEFNNETVTLSLTGLPNHTQVVVSFDLYVIRSWDGNQVDVPNTRELVDLLSPAAVDGRVGPDRWRLKNADQVVIETSFANITSFSQSYPAAFGGADNPAQTGATAVNSLGYTYQNAPMDATYRIVRVLPHTADTLTLNFEALGLQIPEDETWGVDNLTVTVE